MFAFRRESKARTACLFNTLRRSWTDEMRRRARRSCSSRGLQMTVPNSSVVLNRNGLGAPA